MALVARGLALLSVLGPSAALARNDLTVSSVTGPVSADSGATISVGATISWGSAKVAATTVRVSFYLSSDASITPADTPIGDAVVAMAPGETKTATGTARIPPAQPSGTYYVGAFVDSENLIAETSETNNTAAGTITTVTYRPPDLSVASVVGPSSVVVGTNVELRAVVAAAPGASASATATVAFYLSSDSTITDADLRIGAVPVALDPGATAEVAVPYTAAAPTGAYWLGAMVDPDDAVAEADEGNNSLTGPSIQVLPDLDAPVITVSGVVDGAVVTEVPVTICYAADDPNLLTHGGELDLIPFQGCADVTAAGAHVVVVTASDLYSNAASVTVAFVVDLAPPALAVSSPASGAQISATSVEVVAIAGDDAGVATVSANGIVLSPDPDGGYRGAVPLAVEGANPIQVVATDVAGRTTELPITVVRDTMAPALILTAPAQGSVVVSPFAVTGTMTDAGTATLTVDGGPVPVDAAGAFATSVVAALGPRDVVVRAADAAGNAAAIVRRVTVSLPGVQYCYDGAGNMTARLDCPFGSDCAGACP